MKHHSKMKKTKKKKRKVLRDSDDVSLNERTQTPTETTEHHRSENRIIGSCWCEVTKCEYETTRGNCNSENPKTMKEEDRSKMKKKMENNDDATSSSVLPHSKRIVVLVAE